MPVEINASLQQQGRFGLAQKFQIVNGKEVRISIGAKTKQKVYSVHLLALADESNSKLHIAKGWLYLFSATVLTLLLYYLAKSAFKFTLGFNERLFIVVISLIAFIALVMIVLNTSRRKMFYSRYAKVNLFELVCANPDKHSYDNFLATLHKTLQEARDTWGLKPSQQIAGEMRMLRRLANEGIIPQGRYESAKEKLLALSASTSE